MKHCIFGSVSQALFDVSKERDRQISEEGYTPKHDDIEHDPGELCSSGAAYALNAGCLLYPYNGTPISQPELAGWIFDRKYWKPKTPREDLVRAAALIIAEIEMIDRHSEAAQ